MKPFELDRCYQGDCRDLMRQMIAAGVKVRCVVTSPPYWALRDYAVAGQLGLEEVHDCLGWATGARCGDCHLCHMVEVFDLVRDLLADDGTIWVNYGDCYANAVRHGLKNKDLAGMPWRLAFALQASGWYLRQDIVWHKPNPMPESVRDRCTKAHEYVFLLSKSERYYYDFEAMKEPVSGKAHPRGNGMYAKVDSPRGWDTSTGSHRTLTGQYPGNGVGFGRGSEAEHRQRGRIVATGEKDLGPDDQGRKTSDTFGRGAGWRTKQNASFSEAVSDLVAVRNRRSVWSIPTQAYSGAHFATFPEALVEPCILAGTRPGDTVFDLFMGSGTTAKVAQRLGRRWLGCELNEAYIDLQGDRTRQFALEL
jgi:site-specific DNA-methyltransferase (cytosine-N4-specific)